MGFNSGFKGLSISKCVFVTAPERCASGCMHCAKFSVTTCANRVWVRLVHSCRQPGSKGSQFERTNLEKHVCC